MAACWFKSAKIDAESLRLIAVVFGEQICVSETVGDARLFGRVNSARNLNSIFGQTDSINRRAGHTWRATPRIFALDTQSPMMRKSVSLVVSSAPSGPCGLGAKREHKCQCL